MTIFKDEGQNWIEVHTITRVSIAAAAELVTTQTLNREGTILGVSCVLDSNATPADIALCSCSIQNFNSNQIFTGEDRFRINVVLSNGSANAVVMGAMFMIFMRKSQ